MKKTQTTKLALNKNTVKQLTVKSNVKTGGYETYPCSQPCYTVGVNCHPKTPGCPM